ncbi:hypothetical protein Tsp_03172 [Trichinella spiralis]|uniref:hypothetical protein n=1 Tax=Trichinella spiralis TaxID=6334 RepID=UPI0001EFBF93|nr:hypothetical protein Tsp_03172 [Trichinella spiralis]
MLFGFKKGAWFFLNFQIPQFAKRQALRRFPLRNSCTEGPSLHLLLTDPPKQLAYCAVGAERAGMIASSYVQQHIPPCSEQIHKLVIEQSRSRQKNGRKIIVRYNHETRVFPNAFDVSKCKCLVVLFFRLDKHYGHGRFEVD